MATVSLIFNEGKITKTGEVPIWLRIIKDRKTKYISIGIKVKPEFWDKEKNRVRKSHPNSQWMNNFISQRIADANDVAIELEIKNKSVTSRKVKDTIKGKSSQSFIKFAEEHNANLMASGKIATAKKYMVVTKKLNKYLKNTDIMFSDITVPFLKEYERYLKSEFGNRINTIHSNLKAIRKLINDGIKEDLLPLADNPFLRFRLKTEKTKRDFLVDEEILELEKVKLDETQMIHHHRNLYVFATYAGGLRISDLLQLKWKSYDGERLIIKTQKTDDTVAILLPKKAKAIIDSYFTDTAQSDDFIFPFLKKDLDYTIPKVKFNAISSATAHANKNLKILAGKCNIEKNVSNHTSRHSFAVRALKKGMRIEHLSKIMTHASIRTTQIYGKIANEDLEKAMNVLND